jgi:hypothetical protein
MAPVHPLPRKWLRVSIAPPDSDLGVCVIDKMGIHTLLFPCRKNGAEWIDPSTNKAIDIRPTHWRIWADG